MATKPKYELSVDDDRVGHLNEDQTVKKWPRERLDGQPFVRRSAYSSIRLDKAYFVIVPPNTQVSKADIAISKVSPPAAPAVFPPSGKGKDISSD